MHDKAAPRQFSDGDAGGSREVVRWLGFFRGSRKLAQGVSACPVGPILLPFVYCDSCRPFLSPSSHTIYAYKMYYCCMLGYCQRGGAGYLGIQSSEADDEAPVLDGGVQRFHGVLHDVVG